MTLDDFEALGDVRLMHEDMMGCECGEDFLRPIDYKYLKVFIGMMQKFISGKYINFAICDFY